MTVFSVPSEQSTTGEQCGCVYLGASIHRVSVWYSYARLLKSIGGLGSGLRVGNRWGPGLGLRGFSVFSDLFWDPSV